MLGDYLYEFSVIAREGSISRAAERLGMSQSALSRHLSSLEASLGARLVERGAGGALLTEDGRFVAGVADQVAARGRALKAQLRGAAPEGGQARRVTVLHQGESRAVRDALSGARDDLARSQQGRAIVTLGFEGPRFPAQIAQALARHEADVVLAYRYAVEGQLLPAAGGGQPPQDDGALPRLVDATGPAGAACRLRVAPLRSAPCVAVFGRGHPLAGRGTIAVGDLGDCEFVRSIDVDDPANAAWGEFARVCDARGVEPSCRTVSVGSGSSVLPSPALAGGGMVLDADDDANVSLARAAGYAIVRVAGALLDTLAVTRSDDALAVRLVDASAVRMGIRGAGR
jgi:molybdate transport repressor ModE-like protein